MATHHQMAWKPMLGRGVSGRKGEWPAGRKGPQDKRGSPASNVGTKMRVKAGEWLLEQRLKADLTQEELGRLIDVDGNAISNVERGQRVLGPETLEKLVRVLGLDGLEVGKMFLGWTNPWLYRMMFTVRGRPDIQELLDTLPPRKRIDTDTDD